jgi:hypothetical protein
MVVSAADGSLLAVSPAGMVMVTAVSDRSAVSYATGGCSRAMAEPGDDRC